jgi:HEAT repeat protein
MPAEEDIPILIKGLKNPNGLIRAKAARGLAKSGTQARSAFGQLMIAVDDEEQAVREAAVQAIAGIGAESVPTLMQFLSHSDKYVRRNAVWGLGKLGPAAIPALNVLCTALLDSDPRTASGAAQAIGAMGTAGAKAIPALDTAMRGANVVLCRLASKALSQIGPPALPMLLKALRDADPFIRCEAAIALGWMGEHAAPAVSALMAVIDSFRPKLPPTSRPGTHSLIHGSGSASSKTITPPAPPVPDDNASTLDTSRVSAIQALGRIGKAANLAESTLEEIALHEPEPFKGAALMSLRQIRGE